MTPSPESSLASGLAFSAEELAYLKRLNDEVRLLGAVMEAAAGGGFDGDRRPLPGIRERVVHVMAHLPGRMAILIAQAPGTLKSVPGGRGC